MPTQRIIMHIYSLQNALCNDANIPKQLKSGYVCVTCVYELRNLLVLWTTNNPHHVAISSPLVSSFHIRNILLIPFSMFFAYVTHIWTKKIKVREQEMHFQEHATPHCFLFLHQIVHQKFIVIASFITKKILNYFSKCLPCSCISCSHFIFNFFTLEHKSNLWPSRNSCLHSF